MYDTAKEAHEHGLKNVVVTNGYINRKPLEKILPYIDAFNIDLKAFNNDFYRKYTKAMLEPVLESLKIVAKSPAHLEITNLVIPGVNDNETDFMQMTDWIAGELGENVPLHLSRYFPQYKSDILPTPLNTLEKLYNLAKTKLRFVYLGNVSDTLRSSTFCPDCGSLLVKRTGYKVLMSGLNNNGNCLHCNAKTYVVV